MKKTKGGEPEQLLNRKSWANIYVPVLIGIMIYTFFRVDTLLVFKLYEWLQIDGVLDYLREITLGWNIPSFVKYSLPDGLWVYAFTYYLASLWSFDESVGKMKYFIMAIPFFLGVGGEVIQIYFNEIGTFDLYDLAISLFAFFAGYIAVRSSKASKEGDYNYG